MSRLSLCVLIVISTATAASMPARAWDCTPYLRAGKCPESTICKTSELISLDDRLNKAYSSAMRRMPPGQASQFRNDQRAWVTWRDRCRCDATCLQREYQSRIDYLEGLTNPTQTGGAPPPPTPPTGGAKLEIVATGTGFFINSNGDLLTNNHVVEGCVGVVPMVGGTKGKPLSVKVQDSDSDLAIVGTNEHPQEYARLATRSPMPGEHIVVVGFPLGPDLAANASVTVGTVMGLGAGGDLRLIRISAPINGGNSGGPVLAENGALIGVIRATVTDAQNLNIAVNFRTVELFLESFQVPFERESAQDRLDDASLGRKAISYTRMLGCLNTTE